MSSTEILSPPRAPARGSILWEGRDPAHRSAPRKASSRSTSCVTMRNYALRPRRPLTGATNTCQGAGSLYVRNGTVLYSDAGAALFTVIEDTLGSHDTIYGPAANKRRSTLPALTASSVTSSCYLIFIEVLGTFGSNRSAIVINGQFSSCASRSKQ